MSSNWSGPWEVTARVNDLMYTIRAKPEMKINKTVTVAIDRLRLYSQGQDEPVPLTKEAADVEQTGNEMFETIPAFAPHLAQRSNHLPPTNVSQSKITTNVPVITESEDSGEEEEVNGSNLPYLPPSPNQTKPSSPSTPKFTPTWARSCLLYTSPSPRDKRQSRMPSSA